MKDIKFLAAMFIDYELPAEKNFIFKYFRSNLEHAFVRYYLMFRDIDNFVDHTGFYCQRRWLLLLKHRFEKIMMEHNKLKSEFKLTELSIMEAGDFKF